VRDGVSFVYDGSGDCGMKMGGVGGGWDGVREEDKEARTHSSLRFD